MIPEKIIYRFMGGTSFEEPIRHIFKDYDNDGARNGVRLENLKALMENKNFGRYMENTSSLIDVVSFYCDRAFRCHGGDFVNEFMDWLRIQRYGPDKEFILENQNITSIP